MKKNYKIQTLIVFLFVVSFKLGAQLSGIYTINSANATGGTNYQTFNDFKIALGAGVSGPVTVNVVAGSGPYNEQVDFGQVTGMTAVNNIVINGNGCTIQFNSNSSTQPWTIDFSGLDYTTINDLIVIGQGVTYAEPLHLYNGSDYNNFNGCTFTCPFNSSSTYQIPVSVSGNVSSYSSAGISGQYNVWTNCTLNDGYFGATFYGNSTVPYSLGNKLVKCNIRDFYLYGIYGVYNSSMVLQGNILERPTRTNYTTTYGIYISTGCRSCLIDGNRVQKLWALGSNVNGTFYCFYPTVTAGVGFENTWSNNVISDLDNYIGTIYGIFCQGYLQNNFYHNTISLDATAQSSSGTYAIYAYGAGVNIKNNNVTIRRGGSGPKYGLYYASTMSSGTSNGNNVYVNGPQGNNYYGYYAITGTSALSTTNIATAPATWTAPTGFDVNSYCIDPQFTAPGGLNLLTNYLPSNLSFNNLGQNLGIPKDVNSFLRNANTPDIGAYEFAQSPCGGFPAQTSLLSNLSGTVCPGALGSFSVASWTDDLGITYQWQSSTTSSVGPFTAINGATNTACSVPNITVSTWFQPLITCTLSSGFITPPPIKVNIAATTFSSVPYYESFEGIGQANKLPNCSWSASNPSVTCLTYTAAYQNPGAFALTGSNYARFFASPTGSNYFYTNGIQLNAGVTYSASMWYVTEINNYINWNDLSMLIGTGQTPIGLVPIASSNGPAASSGYKSLSNTFTVPTSGIYYLAIRGTCNGTSAQFLTFDDVRITAPCEVNTSTISFITSASTICAGQTTSISATGASSYLWNTGATTAGISVSPPTSAIYSVVGTNLAGCSFNASQAITVKPAPIVTILTPATPVCAGMPTILQAVGANSFNWDNGANTATLSVSPMVNTTYSVIGVNSFGCTGMTSQLLAVNPIPTVSATGPSAICKGETVVLNASGATSYAWSSSSGSSQGNPVSLSPMVSTVYTLTGTSNGCSGTQLISLEVSDCVGINSIATSASGIKLYPNPTNGEFTVELNTTSNKIVTVIDLTGRVILSSNTSDDKVNFNVSKFAAGVYYVKIQSANTTEVLKVVKQ